MDLTKSVILYLILYRISLIIAGMICVFFGYRLFCKGIMNGPKNGGATLDAKGKGIQLTLKNAHPGTFFALFGVALIIFMIALYPPKFSKKTVDELNELGKDGQEQAGTKSISTTEVSLQNIKFDTIISIINEKKDGNYSPDKAYDKLLKEIKDKIEKIDKAFNCNENAEEAFNKLLDLLKIAK